MKMELQSAYADGVDIEARDALRIRLDAILHALDSGEGTTEETASIIALGDPTHSEMIKSLLVKWAALKNEIDNVRSGDDPLTLYIMSEEYFKLANDTVFAAEDFSERQVSRTTTTLLMVNGIVVLFILGAGAFIIRGIAVKRRADALGKIAYIDQLTRLENRASCERVMERLKNSGSIANFALLMFDMNNLKTANDTLGHQAGDKMITQFAKIIGEEAKDYGFLGRYGGDEFLAVFENADTTKADEYLKRVNFRVATYNSQNANSIEHISFAVGVVVGSLADSDIDDLVYEADRAMYANKRAMKKQITDNV
jgi:diguanylate cyclase (GGDEF)-like protein